MGPPFVETPVVTVTIATLFFCRNVFFFQRINMLHIQSKKKAEKQRIAPISHKPKPVDFEYFRQR
jgi:hypothetical protein